MLFDMGIGELLIIGVVGLIVFGPDRLPRAAAQAAQFLRQLREQANTAKATIVEAAAIDEQTLRDLRDLDPRRALRDVAAPVDEARRSADAVARDITRPAAKPAPAAPEQRPADTTTPPAPPTPDLGDIL